MNLPKHLVLATFIALAIPVAVVPFHPSNVIAAQQSQDPVLTIPGNPQTITDKGVRKCIPVEVSGVIEQGHDAAGGNFWLNGGVNRHAILTHFRV